MITFIMDLLNSLIIIIHIFLTNSTWKLDIFGFTHDQSLVYYATLNDVTQWFKKLYKTRKCPC